MLWGFGGWADETKPDRPEFSVSAPIISLHCTRLYQTPALSSTGQSLQTNTKPRHIQEDTCYSHAVLSNTSERTFIETHKVRSVIFLFKKIIFTFQQIGRIWYITEVLIRFNLSSLLPVSSWHSGSIYVAYKEVACLNSLCYKILSHRRFLFSRDCRIPSKLFHVETIYMVKRRENNLFVSLTICMLWDIYVINGHFTLVMCQYFEFNIICNVI